MTNKNLYTILGISKTATEKDIQKAYRKLARKYHPDLNKNNPAAAEKFKEVNLANEILSDTKRRGFYDEFGEESLNPQFDEKRAEMLRQFKRGEHGSAGHGGFDFRNAGFDFDTGNAGPHSHASATGGFASFFEDILSGYGRAQGNRNTYQQQSAQSAPKSSNIDHEIDVALRDAVLGGSVDLVLNTGQGQKSLKVQVPAGSRPGAKIRLPGKKTGLGTDVILKLRILPHPVFKIEEGNLVLNLPVKLSEMLEGATVQVPLLEGRINLKIPPGSQSGAILKVKGKGMGQGASKGDLLVRLELTSPDKVDPECLQLARKLDRYYSRDPRSKLAV